MTHSFGLGATLAMLTATLGLVNYVGRAVPVPLEKPLESLSRELGGWSATGDLELEQSTLVQLHPSQYLSRIYEKSGRKMGLFVAYYAQQRAGESMHSPMVCLPASGWEIWKYGSVEVPVPGMGIVTVNRVNVQNSGERRLVLYWYQSAGDIIASEYAGKLRVIRDTMLTHRASGAIVRLMLPDDGAANDEGAAFAAQLIPLIRECQGGRAAGK